MTRIEPTDWKSVGIIVAGLIAHMNLLKPLGFVPAGLILFMSVAFAFGSRRYGRDTIVGLLLVLFAYVGFHLWPWPATAAGNLEGTALRWTPFLP